MCKVAGLPSDCPGLTWQCSWWWRRKELGFWSSHSPAWFSGWTVFNKCAVPQKSLELNFWSCNPQNSRNGTFVMISICMSLQLLNDACPFERRILYSLWIFEFIRYCRPRFWTWNQSKTSSSPTQTVMLYTRHPQPTPRYTNSLFGCVVGAAAQPRGQPFGQTPVRWGSFPPPKKPGGRNLLRSWLTSTMMPRGVSGTKEIKLYVPASTLLPKFLQRKCCNMRTWVLCWACTITVS